MKSFAVLVTVAALSTAAPLLAFAAPKPAATAKQLSEAAEALRTFDGDRVQKDKAYAEAMLLHADRLAPDAAAVPQFRDAVALIRMMSLASLGRSKDAVAAAQETLKGASPAVPVLGMAVYMAADADDRATAVSIYERAATLSETDRAEFRTMVDEDIVSWTWQRLGQAKDRPGRLRLAEALLALEWPDKDAVSERDSYRSLAIERRLAAGETASAAQLLREIVTPDMLARMAAARKYDALFPEGGDRVALIRQSLGRYDEATRRRLAAAPADPKRLLERGNALRALGRDAEAAALLLPFATDLAKVEAAGEDGFWVVNEAAAALGAVGRHAEAVALMEKLLALGVDTHSGLISMAINHGEVLLGAGRFADAAAHEAKLSQGAKTASPYGYMWMWSMAACGHALGGDAAGAQPWLAKLAANSADNEAAHMRALLCANDMNGAEKLLVARLKGDDPESMLAKLQTYEQGTSPSAAAKVIEPRLLALRDRPAVREAIADVGRILSLPLSKTYFGDY